MDTKKNPISDTKEKPKAAPGKKPEAPKKGTDDKNVCTKPFDAENARGADSDAPCDNGEG